MQQSKFLLWILLFTLTLNSCAQQKSPNILLIIADDLGVDYTSAYKEGTDLPQMPYLDSLVSKGVLFRNAYTHPTCSPTRATIMTGRHPFQTGVGFALQPLQRQGGLDTAEYTLPKVLRENQAGYADVCLGKWHLSTSENGGLQNPHYAGWSTYAGSLGAQPLPLYNQWRKTYNLNGNAMSKSETTYAATDKVDDAVKWIQRQSTSEPWFMWLAFNLSHSPWHLPPVELHGDSSLSSNPIAIQNNPIPYHKAMIEAMDTEMGRLFHHLKEAGQWENTYIIFIGDNGSATQVVQAPFDPNRSKATLYEGGINVPLIISGPDIKGSREISSLVNSSDLFTTILAMAGIDNHNTIPETAQIDSYNLLPLLKDETKKSERIFTFSQQIGSFPGLDDGVAIRNKSYKLISFDNGSEEFYNLDIDPWELSPIEVSSLNGADAVAYQQLVKHRDKILGKTR